MKKKFTIVKVFGYIGETIQVMNVDDYGTCLCKTEILYESDSFKEISDKFISEYMN